MGSTISNNKNIDSIINDLGFTKENLTNELQVIYNKYKKLLDDNKSLKNVNNKYNIILLDKNNKIIELENSITNNENQLSNYKKDNIECIDYKNKFLQLEKDYNKLLSSKTNDLETMRLLISREKQRNIEITNKYQVSLKNESIFQDHNNYLLKVNSKLLKTNNNKPNSITLNSGNLININKQYTELIDNLDYHIKQIIGNHEFNVWIPDHYDKNICEKTIIYILTILSK